MRRRRNTSHFADADGRIEQLSERQLLVLELVAGGKTNAEIAEATGMTFYGAKWHVSEILSKLGLASREEAADYWRWRKRHRLTGRVLTIPGLRWAAGATAAGLALAVAMAVILAGRSDAEPATSPDRPAGFYFEAERTAPGIDISRWSDWPNPLEPTVATAQVWQAATARYRMNSEILLPFIAAGTRSMVVGDGSQRWSYSSVTSTWQRDDAQAELAATDLWGLGIVGDGSWAALLARIEDDGYQVVSTGDGGQIAGRDTTVVLAEQLDKAPLSVWFDREWGIVLGIRHGLDDAASTTNAFVTAIQPRDHFDDGDLTFQPPLGSSELSSDASLPPDTPNYASELSGFRGYAPPPSGWVLHPGGASRGLVEGSPRRLTQTCWYEHQASGAIVVFDQRLRLDSLSLGPAGDSVMLAGREVRHAAKNHNVSILWVDGDVVTEIRGIPGATHDQVAEIATAVLSDN